MLFRTGDACNVCISGVLTVYIVLWIGAVIECLGLWVVYCCLCVAGLDIIGTDECL